MKTIQSSFKTALLLSTGLVAVAGLILTIYAQFLPGNPVLIKLSKTIANP